MPGGAGSIPDLGNWISHVLFVCLSVAKPLLTAQTSVDIRKFIQERNYLNVIYVTKSSDDMYTLLVIREFILERNLTNVMSVASTLVNLHSSYIIRDFMLERNLTNVIIVASTLVNLHSS